MKKLHLSEVSFFFGNMTFYHQNSFLYTQILKLRAYLFKQKKIVRLFVKPGCHSLGISIVENVVFTFKEIYLQNVIKLYSVNFPPISG